MTGCSSFTMTTHDHTHFLSRTMDFNGDMTDSLLFVPKNKTFVTSDKHSDEITTKHCFIGIGQIANDAPITFDGINDAGLMGAALYFPGYAKYLEEKKEETTAVDPDKVIPYALGSASNLNEVKELFKNNISLLNNPDPFLDTEPPLHFIFSDRSGECLIIEPREHGIDIFENNIGVLTNSPDYKWHETNLRNYFHINPRQHQAVDFLGQNMHAFSEGSGTLGTPGDFTPPSRFIRTALAKAYTKQAKNEAEGVSIAHHILETVSVPKGMVMSEQGEPDYTSYTSYMCSNSLTYYFSSYMNQRIQKFTLTEDLFEETDYQTYQFCLKEDIRDIRDCR